jgi:hypothetical protein
MIAWLLHQQRRFMRPDGGRYLRPDIGRFLQPERKWEGQPRIAAGTESGGQFTFGTQSSGGDADGDQFVGTTVNHLEEIVVVASRDGEGGAEGGPGEEDWINSSDNRHIGDNSKHFLEDPPEIPEIKPSRSPSTVLRAAVSWIARALAARAFGAVSFFIGILSARAWVKAKAHEIVTSLDPPRSIEELEAAVDVPRTGTELHHHKMEQHVSRIRGIPQREIDAPGNRVRIPTLKHYDITSWYRTPNENYGGLTPRQYLADKAPDEHARVGREALLLFEVLKP